ncbi:MAG: glycine zipper 2TM domain-containing protein [Caulobacter sp.]|nr:glycine zipper 2TM domain-containing protein [Caulobacter sp.]
MRKITTLAVCAAMSLPVFTAPTLASAQQYRDYGRGQPCAVQKKQAKKEGAIAGAIIGGVLGAAVAGDDDRGKGALVGGTVGAFAGREVGRKNVRCASYPARVSYRRENCRWVQEYRGGRWHGFEVCRDRRGVWRPSGRH